MERWAVLATLSLVAALAAPASADAVVFRGKVQSVVDGDTVKVRVGARIQTVRLIGVDTPETKHPSKPVQCWGPQASAQAMRLMRRGRNVRRETDPTQARRDRFGRLLAYVYTGRSRRANSVNRELVKRGAGTVLVVGRNFRFFRQFKAAENQAMRRNRGLWGPPCNGNVDQPVGGGQPNPQPQPGCDLNYTGACVPRFPPEVDCSDVGKPVGVVADDPHNLDRDGDGRACESFG